MMTDKNESLTTHVTIRLKKTLSTICGAHHKQYIYSIKLNHSINLGTKEIFEIYCVYGSIWKLVEK